MLDYYKLLNIRRTANSEEVKKAYRLAALFWHPDKNKSPQAHQKFIDISEAYNILIDPHRRVVYDELFQSEMEINLTPKPNASHHSQKHKQSTYEEWVREERSKAEKISIISSDKILTEGFHFIDQYGLFLLLIAMFIFMIIVFSNK